MNWLFLTLLNRSIAAGWMVLAILLLRPLLKKAPQWMNCLLWALAAVRLVSPFSPESILSLIPSAQILRPEVVKFSLAPTVDSGVPLLNRLVNPGFSQAFAGSPAASVNPLYVWIYLAGIIWAAGVLAMLLYAAVSYWRLGRSLREAARLRDNIWLCDRVATPFLLGLARPKIYLPSGLEEDQTAYVLAHETAHLNRRDHWWKALGYLLLAVYWFQPLFWLAYCLFCRDIELACDQRVVEKLDLAGKKAYAETLLACGSRQRPRWTCPPAFGEVGVKKRVKNVLAYQKPAGWRMIAAAAAWIAVAACFLTNPKQDGLSLLNYRNLAAVAYQTEALTVRAHQTGRQWQISGQTLGELLAEADWDKTGWRDLSGQQSLDVPLNGQTAIFFFEQEGLAMVQVNGRQQYYRMDDEARREIFDRLGSAD